MVSNIKDKFSFFYSDKNLSILLTFWLISFFFGSKIGAISIGFITIYPNLIVSLFFFPLLFSQNFFSQFLNKKYIWLLLFFIGYTIFWIFANNTIDGSIFELRSWIFHFITFYVILVSYTSFQDKKKFISIVSNILWLWFIVLILFGFIEIITGYHFVGEYTEKISTLPLSLIDFAPVFIFDNPNDYILNCLGIFFILLIVDSKNFKNRWVLISVILVLLILSIYCAARIAQFILILLLIYKFFDRFFSFLIFQLKSKWHIVLVFAVSIILLVSYNPIYWGRNLTDINIRFYGTSIFQFKNGEYHAVNALNILNKENKIELNNELNIINSKPGFNSKDIRLKLFENGIFLISNHPFLGVGPGQFQIMNAQKKVPYDIGNNSSPHNYIIELISNYGVLGWLFLGYLLWLFYTLFDKDRLQNKWLILTLIFFILSSFLPSAFIYQPINWLFMSFWILYVDNRNLLKNVE